MQDADKFRDQLIADNTALRQRMADMEAALAEHAQREKIFEANERRYQQAQHRIEKKLRYSETYFRSLVQNASDIIAQYALNGTVHYYSPSIERVLGYCPDDLIGRNVFGAIHPEDVQRVKEAMLGLAQRPGVTQDIELRLRHRDGTWRLFEAVGSYALDERNLRCIVVNARDITERNRVEAALRESEARLRAFANALPDLAFILDQDGRYHEVPTTQDHLLYREADQLKGRRMHEVLPKRDADRFLAMIQQTLHTGIPQVLEYGLDVQAGRRWFEARTSPMQGASDMVVWVSRDITDRKQAEEERQRLEDQLRQSQKMDAIGALAGGIAHECNNTLSAIIGYTELTQQEMPHGTPAWSNLQEVLKASGRAKDFVQQILSFSRQSDPVRKPLVVSEVIQDLFSFLRASLPATIHLRQDIQDHGGTVLANATQLHQVLMNLCTNAEYALRPTGGVLEIRVDPVEIDAMFAASHPDLQPGSYIRLRLHDSGAGMAPEVLERIFEPFFTTKEIGAGTGMGLAIVHGIIRSHEGAITVESALGEGTTVSIYLPRIARDPAPAVHPAETLRPQGRGRILFVDDEETLAHLGQARLEKLGYEVVAYTSSVKALAAFRSTPQQFDLVITDQTMPVMTGERLVGELRHIRPDIPVILCTGFSHAMNAKRAQELGVDAFLIKPVVTQDLAVTINQILVKRAESNGC